MVDFLLFCLSLGLYLLLLCMWVPAAESVSTFGEVHFVGISSGLLLNAHSKHLSRTWSPRARRVRLPNTKHRGFYRTLQAPIEAKVSHTTHTRNWIVEKWMLVGSEVAVDEGVCTLRTQVPAVSVRVGDVWVFDVITFGTGCIGVS